MLISKSEEKWRELDEIARTVISDRRLVPKTKAEMEWAIENEFVIPDFRDGIITVDKLLDNVDVSMEWYTPSVDAFDFINFIRLVLGEEPENVNPIAHYFYADAIFGHDNIKSFFIVRNIDFDSLDDRLAIMASREFAKSTLVVYMILYMADKGKLPNYGDVNYVLYISDSMRNGVETTMKTIAAVYNESVYLQDRFEEARLVVDEVNFVRRPRTKKEQELYNLFVNVRKEKPENVPGRMKRSFTLRGVGGQQGVRGTRSGLSRPNGAIIDDIVSSEEDAKSDTILKKLESTIDADVLSGLSGNGNFAIAIGTPYNKKDPVYSRVESGNWLPVVFPRAEAIPDDDLKEEDFKSVWPDRHTYKQCRRAYIQAKKSEDSGNFGPMRTLLQEHYIRISSEEDRMVTESMIQWFNRTNIIKNSFDYNWYFTTDFTSTGSRGSDFSGIALWAVDSDQNFFLMELSLKKIELEEQYTVMFDMARRHRANVRWLEAGVEIDGQQNIHLLALKDRMAKYSLFFAFTRQRGAKIGQEGIRSRLQGGNKHWRFRSMLPMFQNHKIWFPKELENTTDMKELMEEIRLVTYTSINSKHDDGLDLLSMLGMLDVNFPAPGAGSGFTRTEPVKKRNRNPMWANGADTYGENEGSSYDSYS